MYVRTYSCGCIPTCEFNTRMAFQVASWTVPHCVLWMRECAVSFSGCIASTDWAVGGLWLQGHTLHRHGGVFFRDHHPCRRLGSNLPAHTPPPHTLGGAGSCCCRQPPLRCSHRASCCRRDISANHSNQGPQDRPPARENRVGRISSKRFVMRFCRVPYQAKCSQTSVCECMECRGFFLPEAGLENSKF